mmetsp:Transcript_22853/g.38174  ORF Transcript_22853/g.38174 Transcript_22853/m.38174 type:complete len:223 (-) Transcript_22853:4304-4972(-)
MCPSLYAENCESSEFRKRSTTNANLCVSINAGEAVDDPSCAEFDKARCASLEPCDPNHINPVKAFNCQRSVPHCPNSTKALRTKYDNVLEQLDEALKPYAKVIEFDPDVLDDEEALCAFSREDFEALRENSGADDARLRKFSEELSILGGCSDVALEMVSSETPPSDQVSSSLWSSLRTNLSRQMETIEGRRGASRANIKELEEASNKVDPLYGMYLGFCSE